MPEDPDEIKSHIMARRKAVVICTQEITLLSEKLRAKLGPVEWLKWMSESVKDGQDDIITQFIKQQQEAANGGKPDPTHPTP